MAIEKSLGVITSINETHEAFLFERQFEYSTYDSDDGFYMVDLDSPTEDNLIQIVEVNNSRYNFSSVNGDDWWMLHKYYPDNTSMKLAAQQSYIEEEQFVFSNFRISRWRSNGVYDYIEINEMDCSIILTDEFLYYRIEALYEPHS